MIDICNFGPGLARGGNTLMLGGNDRKAASFRALVEAWTREPFALNETVGESSANIANAVRQAAYQEIRSRDANDKFFDDLGKLVTDRMIVYMLETEKNVLRNIAGGREIEEVLGRLNLFSIFCRQHKYVESLMTKAVSGEKDALPDKRDQGRGERRRAAHARACSRGVRA